MVKEQPYSIVVERCNEMPTDAQPYKYGGKELDRENGLDSYDFGARVYDPAVGRFTAPDPLAWDTTWVSPYSYCASNPIRYIDPTGINAMMDKRIPLNIFIKGGLEFIQHYKSLGKTDDAYVRNITRASNVIQQFISVR